MESTSWGSGNATQYTLFNEELDVEPSIQPFIPEGPKYMSLYRKTKRMKAFVQSMIAKSEENALKLFSEENVLKAMELVVDEFDAFIKRNQSKIDNDDWSNKERDYVNFLKSLPYTLTKNMTNYDTGLSHRKLDVQKKYQHIIHTFIMLKRAFKLFNVPYINAGIHLEFACILMMYRTSETPPQGIPYSDFWNIFCIFKNGLTTQFVTSDLKNNKLNSKKKVSRYIRLNVFCSSLHQLLMKLTDISMLRLDFSPLEIE